MTTRRFHEYQKQSQREVEEEEVEFFCIGRSSAQPTNSGTDAISQSMNISNFPEGVIYH
jgi:hypothetical protein